MPYALLMMSNDVFKIHHYNDVCQIHL